MLCTTFGNLQTVLFLRPRGHIFTWWRCYGLCQRHKPTELARPSLFCSCVYFCLCGPFDSISFHKFSRQLSVFLLCSPSLISAVLVLSTTYLSKSLPKWFQRPSTFAVHCNLCQGSWRLRYPLAVACWGQYISLARTSLRRVVGLDWPNQSAGRAEP